MASNDAELIKEVLDLTDYHGVLDQSQVWSLVAIAKDEIETEVGQESLNFYANQPANRALFWLTCLFSKIKTGEYEGMDLIVSEIEMNRIPDNEGTIWLKQFEKKIRQLSSSDRTYVANLNRTERSYGDS